MGLGVTRIDADALPIGIHRLINLLEFHQSNAEVVVSRRASGVETNGLAKSGEGIPGISEEREPDAEVVVDYGTFGTDTQLD
jgi:hypothetical protein